MKLNPFFSSSFSSHSLEPLEHWVTEVALSMTLLPGLKGRLSLLGKALGEHWVSKKEVHCLDSQRQMSFLLEDWLSWGLLSH
ncbi:hypothetical protein Golob_011007 [Gossypium lobatum]|uniref:Uncharacterized protein n=1 Tax=Gossypium lobatum TaxID=34289 RepID=A0A7J8MNI8_9ROSI|nr:hypothetical protein [Gossypium lobatum]